MKRNLLASFTIFFIAVILISTLVWISQKQRLKALSLTINSAPLGEGVLNPKDTFRDCPKCPEMVIIPGGSFVMGSNTENMDERPAHRVIVNHTFSVGKYKITRGQYAFFASATGLSTVAGCKLYSELYAKEKEKGFTANWKDPGFNQTDDHPVTCVSWNDAQNYIAWLNKEFGAGYRLLSEAEWEYVARAGTTTKYSFGNDITSTQANFGNYIGMTTPVGMYEANGFGLHDMHGNLWEWVEDCYKNNYDEKSSNEAVHTELDFCMRVMRGGSWNDTAPFLRSSSRSCNSMHARDNYSGFRVAKELP